MLRCFLPLLLLCSAAGWARRDAAATGNYEPLSMEYEKKSR